MKKTKQEAERDLLAKNHRRLNKAIDDLLQENRELRRKLEKSILEINDLREKMRAKDNETLTDNVRICIHALAGRFDLASEQVAERSFLIAQAVGKKLSVNDNNGG